METGGKQDVKYRLAEQSSGFESSSDLTINHLIEELISVQGKLFNCLKGLCQNKP